jgi:hypothetical protein
MKIPVGIDLRRASCTLCQFRDGVDFGGEVDSGSGRGGSNGPTTPFQIMARASTARVICNWDKAAIFCRSWLFVLLSVSSVNSSLILLTSCETCVDNISGNLRCDDEHPLTIQARVTHEREKLENTSSTILQCARFLWMWALARSLRVGISY